VPEDNPRPRPRTRIVRRAPEAPITEQLAEQQMAATTMAAFNRTYQQYVTYLRTQHAEAVNYATWGVPNGLIQAPPPNPPQAPAKPTEPIKEGEDEMPGKRVNTFRIGADPEFVILNGGKIVNVQDTLTDIEAGYDHGGYVVELRPAPAFGAYTLVKRLQKILKTNAKLAKIKDHKWKAGAYFYDPATRAITLGGHVHIDKNPKEEEQTLLVSALDRLTKYLEDLDILPKEESAKRRNSTTGYGRFGDIRKSNDGNHIEYRSMSSWLSDPKQAFLALTGAKLAATNPQITLDCLRPKAHSFEGLKTFFDYYKHKDVDAGRAIEKILDDTIEKCQTDPDQDIKESWRELSI
jgi:hypothetical protein